MIATLCWKEYREQRGVWLAIVVVAVLLVIGVGSMAEHGLWRVQQDEAIRSTLMFLMVSLVAGHGVVCGAQLLAGEKETGTLIFLDTLSAQRAPIWHTKFVMGCLLTLTQSQILAGLAVFFELTTWPALLLFPLYALLSVFGLCWGLVGGALCRLMVPAIVTGAGLMIAGLVLTVNVPPVVSPVLLLSMGGLAAAWSWNAFCRTEKPRSRPRRGLPLGRLLFLATGRCRRWLAAYLRHMRNNVFWWLSLRQGRWIIVFGLAGSLLTGFLMAKTIPAFWTSLPLATLAVGLVCGLAVFAPEQIGEQERFLGSQRIPPGRLWFHKNVFWALACALMWFFMLFVPVTFSGPKNESGVFFQFWMWNPWLCLVTCPIYGFCFGQFFVFLTRRIIVAVVVSAFAALAVLTAWLPSLLCGGVSAWQILAIPLLFLIAGRLTMWIWLCGRTFTRKHILGLVGCALLSLLWLAGNFWYRAVEYPDVGEPFDVAEYEAELDRAARNEAGMMIRRAAAEQVVQRNKVEDKLGPSSRRPFPDATEKPKDFLSLSRAVPENGWPADDAEIGRWLDAIFADPWAEKMRAAAKMPLGMIVDPRQVSPTTQWTDQLNCSDCAHLFSIRALQLQKRGDPDAGFDHLDVALALSRQVRHHATHKPFLIGIDMEKAPRKCFDHWLAGVGPDAGRIRRGLNLLRSHEADAPGVMDSFKAQYVSILTHLSEFQLFRFGKATFALEERVYRLATEVPWERERTLRLLNVKSDLKIRMEGSEYMTIVAALRVELPGLQSDSAKSQFWLHARLLVAALALYEVENGKPAAKLDDLVPNYLAKVPVDPVTGKAAFAYRIGQQDKIRPLQAASALGVLAAPNGRGPLLATSTLVAASGDLIQGIFGESNREETRRLFPGQGMVWVGRYAPIVSVEPNYLKARLQSPPEDQLYFLVPRWTK